MYIAYGWPKVIKTEEQDGGTQSPCIYLQAIGKLLIVVKTNVVQVCNRQRESTKDNG